MQIGFIPFSRVVILAVAGIVVGNVERYYIKHYFI